MPPAPLTSGAMGNRGDHEKPPEGGRRPYGASEQSPYPPGPQPAPGSGYESFAGPDPNSPARWPPGAPAEGTRGRTYPAPDSNPYQTRPHGGGQWYGSQSPYGAPAPGGKPWAYGGPGGFKADPPPEPSRGANVPLIVGAVVAVFLLLVGGGGALALTLRDDIAGAVGSLPDAAPTPAPATGTPIAAPTGPVASPAPLPTGDPFTRLDSRENDSEPLRLDELFADRKVRTGHTTYRRAARDARENCASAVRGVALRKALRRGACTQVLRASYVSDNGKIIGTIGIANLADAKAVRRAVQSATGSSNHVDPLPGAGPARHLGRGSALGGPMAQGHYLVLSWIQYTDGHRPSSTRDKRLLAFDQDVFEQTVLSALTHRMLTGKPLMP